MSDDDVLAQVAQAIHDYICGSGSRFAECQGCDWDWLDIAETLTPLIRAECDKAAREHGEKISKTIEAICWRSDPSPEAVRSLAASIARSTPVGRE